MRPVASDTRFARVSALTLFLAAGVVTLTNSFVVHSRLIDVTALRVTGVTAILLGVLIYRCRGGCTRALSGGS